MANSCTVIPHESVSTVSQNVILDVVESVDQSNDNTSTTQSTTTETKTEQKDESETATTATVKIPPLNHKKMTASPPPPPPPPPPSLNNLNSLNQSPFLPPITTLTQHLNHRKNGKKQRHRGRKSKLSTSNIIRYSYWNPKPKNKCIGTMQSPIYLICSDDYVELCDKLEADKNKYSIFWELCKGYKLNDEQLYGNKLKIIDSSTCCRDDLLLYHDENYINLLETVENYPPYSLQTEEEQQTINEYGLVDDCPIFDGLYDYCLNITGSSLKCAELIKTEQTRIAINFGGGRHHAFSSKASGYCYVNDIILCIDSLRNDTNHKFNKILYIDLDLHHGDAIQEAYYNSNDVFVVSIHHKDVDFFPQTGDKNKFGDKHGLFHNLNIPITNKLKLRDDAFCDIVSKVCHRLNYYFQPDCIVVCCGCDGLQSDPFNKWNLSINGIAKAVNIILTQMDKPTIILGGGGYNAVDTAKCWMKVVANAANINITNDIPYHVNFGQFAPHYQLNKMKLTDQQLIAYNNHNGLDRKKQQKANIQALQIIYGHLNNFERLFVSKNLKNNHSGNKNKKSQSKDNKVKHKLDMSHSDEIKEKEDLDHILDDDEEDEVEDDIVDDVNDGMNGNDKDDQEQQDDMDIIKDSTDKIVIDHDDNDNHNKSIGNNHKNNKRLIASITTNTCRSRRKRRKIECSKSD